jgi:hypothetical protein
VLEMTEHRPERKRGPKRHLKILADALHSGHIAVEYECYE